MWDGSQVKPGKGEPQYVQSPLTTKREALSLYRAARQPHLARFTLQQGPQPPSTPKRVAQPRGGTDQHAAYVIADLQILRASLLFVWKDNNGRVWREVIRESARKEFESAR